MSDALRQGLLAMEAQREARQKRACVIEMGVLFEVLMRRVVAARVEAEPALRPTVVRVTGSEDLGAHGMGQLIYAWDALGLIEPGTRGRFDSARDLRNWAAHAKGDGTPNWKTVEAAIELLWSQLVVHGLVDAGLRVRARQKRAPQRYTQSISAMSLDDLAMTLDRHAHRRMVAERVEAARRGLVVVLHGEMDQGHRHLAEFCLGTVQRARPGLWAGPAAVRWPEPQWPEARRFGELVEQLCAVLDRHGVAVSPDAPGEALRRAGAQVFVRHEILAPVPEDAALLRRYLEAVWGPVVAEGEGQLASCLTFELHTPAARGWYFGAAARAARRARKAVAEALRALGDVQAGGLTVAPLPELTSVGVDDILHALPDGVRRQLSPDEARARAREVHSLSAEGRFEHVLRHLDARDLRDQSGWSP